MINWIKRRIARRKIQLVIRGDYDVSQLLNRIMLNTNARSHGEVVECALHALDAMVETRNRGGSVAFVQDDMGLVPFKPDYLYGQDSNDT